MLRLSLAPSYGLLTRTVTKLTGLGGPDGEWDDVFLGGVEGWLPGSLTWTLNTVSAFSQTKLVFI